MSSTNGSSAPLVASNALKYFAVLGKLKTLKRTGWVNNDIVLPESVADHMYRLVQILVHLSRVDICIMI